MLSRGGALLQLTRKSGDQFPDCSLIRGCEESVPTETVIGNLCLANPAFVQRAIRRTCEWKARKLRRSRCSRHCKPRRVGCYRKIAHRHVLSTRGCSDTVNAGNYRLGDLREDDHLARERIKSLSPIQGEGCHTNSSGLSGHTVLLPSTYRRRA